MRSGRKYGGIFTRNTRLLSINNVSTSSLSEHLVNRQHSGVNYSSSLTTSIFGTPTSSTPIFRKNNYPESIPNRKHSDLTISSDLKHPHESVLRLLQQMIKEFHKQNLDPSVSANAYYCQCLHCIIKEGKTDLINSDDGYFTAAIQLDKQEDGNPITRALMDMGGIPTQRNIEFAERYGNESAAAMLSLHLSSKRPSSRMG